MTSHIKTTSCVLSEEHPQDILELAVRVPENDEPFPQLEIQDALSTLYLGMRSLIQWVHVACAP